MLIVRGKMNIEKEIWKVFMIDIVEKDIVSQNRDRKEFMIKREEILCAYDRDRKRKKYCALLWLERYARFTKMQIDLGQTLRKMNVPSSPTQTHVEV